MVGKEVVKSTSKERRTTLAKHSWIVVVHNISKAGLTRRPQYSLFSIILTDIFNYNFHYKFYYSLTIYYRFIFQRADGSLEAIH